MRYLSHRVLKVDIHVESIIRRMIKKVRFQGHFEGQKAHQGKKCRFYKFIYLSSLELHQKHEIQISEHLKIQDGGHFSWWWPLLFPK